MSQTQVSNAELLNQGVNADFTAETPSDLLMGFMIEENRLAFGNDIAGYGQCAEAFRLTPHDPIWDVPMNRSLLEAICDEVAEDTHGSDDDFEHAKWTRFFCGVYSVSGSLNALHEIIRRARHRNGSGTSLQTGTDAVVMLSQAFEQFPDVQQTLIKCGFNPGNIKVGDLPKPFLSPAKFRDLILDPPPPPPTPETASAAPTPEMASADDPYAEKVWPNPESVGEVVQVRRPGPDYFANEVSLVPEFDIGLVCLSTPHGQGMLTISQAMDVEIKAIKATRALLLPRPNCAWMDDTMQPKKFSELIDEEGKVLGQVQQAQSGRYQAFLKTPELELKTVGDGTNDMLDAKFQVAEAVRKTVPAPEG